MKNKLKPFNFFKKNNANNINILSFKKNFSFNVSNSGQIFQQQNEPKIQEPADFETAIEATGFGLYNCLLMLCAIPCAMAIGFDSTSLAFVLPVAQCDLELTLFKKGTFNAITYLGMVTTPFFWGFFADTFGRRKLLIFGFIFAGIFDIGAAIATNYWVLLIFKFLDGATICGPFAVLTTYLAEMHGFQHRSKIVLFNGLCSSCINLILPAFAWAILPRNLVFQLFNGFLNYHSWNVFLFGAAMPALVAASMVSLFPESPKFLMSLGKNNEALQIFRTIYALNTGNSKESYPIRVLYDETLEQNQQPITMTKRDSSFSLKSIRSTFGEKISTGWQQIRPLFHKPYLSKIILMFSTQHVAMIGLSTLRLWMPQLFSLISLYQDKHPNESASLCTMISSGGSSHSNSTSLSENFVLEDCIPGSVKDSVFINYMILGATQAVFYLVAGAIIGYVGKKNITMVLLWVSGLLGFSMYLAQSSQQTLIFSALYLAFSSIAITCLISISTEVVPTSLRTMTVSLLMMCGRFGALFGNLLFPIFMEIDCVLPFLLVGGTTFVCGFAVYFLPKTDDKPLQ
ncbi:synaptic vesicle glycoprotein 2B-like [Chrysoperla carnea]|uniref:synaptic vesicle glycoprotein 2B-like n=1 Tax=Chrysoperla carnea TaxID=189513 RepID=UPI001D06980C|nr:synaptic vesicle glycoprotein 2B-like [Chrysoperla carnea]